MSESIPSPCPFLPLPEREFTVEDIQAFGKDRGRGFYETALNYAQSFWFRGFPAKTLLLINRALSCHLPGVSLRDPAKPYHAVAWVLLNSPAEKFMGNPRRHYQHLATRMVEPHKELRSWRAWACWYLAKHVLDENLHPADAKQIREEGVVEPTYAEISSNLLRLSPSDDEAAWREALEWAATEKGKPLPTPAPSLEIRVIDASGLEEVQRLAHRIWPETYASLISQEQIRYMLARNYELEVMRVEMEERQVKFALIILPEGSAGYLSWGPSEGEGSVFLHKLYVLPQFHGRGIGARALEWLADLSLKNGATELHLRVNRNNHRAIRAYLRQGFAFDSDLCTDFGEGYVMDDHVMVRRLR